MKMLIILEPHGIYGSNFAYLCFFLPSPATVMKKGDEASPSIILASRAL